MPRRESTDAEREQRRTADRERLQRAVTQLNDSEDWKRWVRSAPQWPGPLLVPYLGPRVSFTSRDSGWLANDMSLACPGGERQLSALRR
jgi:hypothetical protein